MWRSHEAACGSVVNIFDESAMLPYEEVVWHLRGFTQITDCNNSYSLTPVERDFFGLDHMHGSHIVFCQLVTFVHFINTGNTVIM